VHFVLKSVSSGARARLFAEALPGCRVIFLMRHPGGQISSIMRGASLGKFDLHAAGAELLACDTAGRYGLRAQQYEKLPIFDQLVWNWVLYNEKVMDDLADVPTARIARHQDIARDPLGQFKELFGFAGLSWPEQTERFIEQSSTRRSGSGYYSIIRRSAETLDEWRKRISPADQDRMRAILRDTAIARRWPDLLE
jgi:hypothetical protein